MKRKFIWFDDSVFTKGCRKPFWDFSVVEREIGDQDLIWIHRGYGRMVLYRLWRVDDENFIAEDLHIGCYTGSPEWNSYFENPELALAK